MPDPYADFSLGFLGFAFGSDFFLATFIRGRAIRPAGADLVMGSCLIAAMVWKGMGKGAGVDNTL